MRAEEALLLLLRVGAGGDPVGGDCAVLSRAGDGSTDALAVVLAFDGDGDTADRFAAGAPPPPDLGENAAGLEEASRFTGVLRGETGGFLGDAAADPRDVCLAAAARRVAGRVRTDEAPPLDTGLPPAASRACLMFLNCRLISAVWEYGGTWWVRRTHGVRAD